MTLLELIDEKIKGVEGLRDCDIEREFKTLRALKAAVEALELAQRLTGNPSAISSESREILERSMTQIKSIIEGEK